MTVRRLSGIEGAREAVGTAVIIDVFRAFTTAAFCIAAGAREVALVADHAHALALQANDPDLFLTGEIGGRPIPGFDIGNSPSRIDGLDLSGRRVVQRTSSGTQGVAAAAGATEIVLGSLVIAGATVRYLHGRDAVSLVAMGTDGGDDHDEDEICAAYLEQLLLDAAPAKPTISLASAEDWPDWFPRRDAELALEVDRFRFALPVTREDGLLIARPVFV
ncbi:MAG: 2-phosphosulfolactate phosphatase [Chloroflexota bacterium]|nr:2-phosphosulfolactate phosphatase [Chloroflexota bacterium]